MNTYLHNIEKQYDRHISIHRVMLIKSAIIGLFSILSMIVSALLDHNGSIVAFFVALCCTLITFFTMSEKIAFSVRELTFKDGNGINMDKVRDRMNLGVDGAGDIAFTIKHFALGMLNIEKQCFRMGICHSLAIGFMIGGYVGMFSWWILE